MKVKDITNYLEEWAPPSLQESYDNSGLLVGNASAEVKGISITLDINEDVLDEAIKNGDNLIIAHHPLIFKGLKRLTGAHWVERCLMKAIKNDLVLYAIHTNLDNIVSGVNHKIAEKLGLINTTLLAPKKDNLRKLVTFVPIENKDQVLKALYAAGVGQIGAYDHCSFQVEGTGTFRPGEGTHPHIGTKNKEEEVHEVRLEVIFPTYLSDQALTALKEAHPYEEVAYYLSSLENTNQDTGSGMIGELEAPVESKKFLLLLKEKMKTETIRHTAICKEKIQRVAVCGGAGSFLLSRATSKKADIFITADFKYHDFFEADGQVIVADIGHYESEQFTKDLLYEVLSKKFTNIAIRLSEVVTNPIKYL